MESIILRVLSGAFPVAVLAALLPRFAYAAATSEYWECGIFSSQGIRSFTNISLTMSVATDRERGTISVAGDQFEALFKVEGINRRWDWNDRYALVLRPDGQATYYDFNFADEEGLASGRMVLPCREVSLAERLGRFNENLQNGFPLDN